MDGGSVNVEFLHLEMIKERNNLAVDDEIIVFYETDPHLEDVFGFDPNKIGLRVITLGHYPLQNTEDEDDVRWFGIFGTTKKWIEESNYLNDLDNEFGRGIDGAIS
jgi:hypothetical protein